MKEIEALDDDGAGDAPAFLRLQASPEDEGKRLDATLAKAAGGTGLSRSRIGQLIKSGQAAVDGSVANQPSLKVRSGMQLELTLPPLEEAEPQPENIPLDTVFEDDDLIVINKPSGLVVHPGPGNPSGTLVNALLHHCGASLSGIGGVRRPGIVHRLDKDTSGLMVVAKNDGAHQNLSEQFADHGRTNDLERCYVAFVWGDTPSEVTIDAPIGRDPSNRLRMAVTNHAGSREAVTHMTRTATYGPADRVAVSQVICRLETGRTHQIRVHLAHIGHGLVGDPVYGRGGRTKAELLNEAGKEAALGFARQALQARLLQFTHPKTAEILRFESDLDCDLEGLRAALAQA